MTLCVLDEDDSDDDNSDNASCASDATEKKPLGFSDLAERFHSVRVNVKPNQLLSYTAQYPYEATPRVKALAGYTNPIFHVTQMSDLEGFNQIADVSTCKAENVKYSRRGFVDDGKLGRTHDSLQNVEGHYD